MAKNNRRRMGVVSLCFELNETICSDLCQIKDFLESLIRKINTVVENDSTLFDIKVILHELVANGAIHGNCSDIDKNISVHVELDAKCIRIEVTDEGEGFCYSRDQYDPLSMKCSGRGLVIVDGLSDEFYIHKNKVVSIKYL